MRPRSETPTMDIYLPADFHELHDSVADDWRDVSFQRGRLDIFVSPKLLQKSKSSGD